MQLSLWLTLVSTTLIAGLGRGFTGFGGALVMAPVFMTFMDPVTATTIILIVNTVVGLANLREVGAETDWSIAKPLSIAGCIASPIGLWLVTSIDVDLVRRTVALIVLAASLGLALRWKFPFSIRHRIGNAVLGATSGSLFGLGGVGGPPVIIGMLAEDLPARVTRATLLTYFAIVQTCTLVLMTLEGGVAGEGVWYGVAMIVPYYLGSALGLRLLTPERAPLFRGVSIAVLVAVATYGLLPH
ncbi:MAG: hypothetical protein RL469_338 [Pseudomonadota bacterium]